MSEPKTSPNLTYRPAGPNDAVLIGRLLYEAFGRDQEARLVGALRTSDAVTLELVATDGFNILGHILFSQVQVTEGDTSLSIVMLAPLSVRPDMQRGGIGTALMEQGLERLKSEKVDIAVVVGDPAYYTRAGFSPALGEKFDTPWSGPNFLAIEISEGAGDRLPATLNFAQPLLDAD